MLLSRTKRSVYWASQDTLGFFSNYEAINAAGSQIESRDTGNGDEGKEGGGGIVTFDLQDKRAENLVDSWNTPEPSLRLSLNQ